MSADGHETAYASKERHIMACKDAVPKNDLGHGPATKSRLLRFMLVRCTAVGARPSREK